MRWLELANRNFKTMWRDWLPLTVNVALPLALLLIFQALESVDDFFAPTSLAPGVVVFGFVMLTMTSALELAQDRESSLFARLLTTPLSARDFVLAYSAPYIAVAIIQAVLVFTVAALLGAGTEGSPIWVVLVLLAMALLYVGVGMIIGTSVSYKAVPGPWAIVLMLTIFGGAWMNLDDIGGVFRSVADWFPFAHALDATRAVMVDGAGGGDIAADLVWVIAYASATASAAVVVFRSRMIE